MTKRTKKEEPVGEFKLDFTGKMIIMAELESHGPIQWKVNDKRVVLDVLKLLIDRMGDTMDVDSYGKREEKSLKKMMDEIK